MGNELQKSLGAKAQKIMPMFDPEDLVLVTDESHPLYDERVKWAPSEALIKNIMVYGVIEPVIVRKNGVRDGIPVVEVIDGRQRVKAAIEANKRLAKEGAVLIRVPTITRGGDDLSLMGVMVSANEIRRGDELIIKARKAQRLLDNGATEEDVAISFGCTTASVKNYISLLDCCKEVISAVSSGEISADAARKLSKLPREEQKKTFDKMRDNGATKGRKADKVVQEATGKPASGGMGKKQIKRILHNLTGAARESEDESERDKFSFGVLILQHILGERDQPFENPRVGALVEEEGINEELTTNETKVKGKRGRKPGIKK